MPGIKNKNGPKKVKELPVDEVLKRIKEMRKRTRPINYSPEEIKKVIEEGRP